MMHIKRATPVNLTEFKAFVIGLNDLLKNAYPNPIDRYNAILNNPIVSSYVSPDDYTNVYNGGKRKKTQRKKKKRAKKTKSKAKKQSKKSKKSKKSRKSKKRRT